MKHYNMTILTIALAVALVFCLIRCKPRTTTETDTAPTEKYEKPRIPDWHKNATIYEVNLRHFTPENTFKSFEAHIPRLKEMGIDILWFMPIHEVSLKNRKGELGSPYAVKDFKGVNPDYGTLDDFKSMLKAIHDAGMYCIIDWVPNHTGWDNPWITKHPDWYTQDSLGNIIDPIDPGTGKSWGWTDVADLNYDNQEMRLGMIDAMKFWIKDIGIDGFRVDVAHNVPVDFWEQCTDTLYNVKPFFMMAEAEVKEFRNTGCFVADYGWEMHHILNDIARSQGANTDKTTKLVNGNLVDGSGKALEAKTALDIDSCLAKKKHEVTKGYSLQFTSNHDENSWAGTEFQRMGAGHKAFAVLTATFDGMPLIYTGQESAMNKQLEFFVKDSVPWGNYEYAGFYKTLFDLKHRNKALWNGIHGGPLVKIPTGNDEHVYAFVREKEEDKVVVVINLSSKPQKATLQGNAFVGDYEELFAVDGVSLKKGHTMNLAPWEYHVYSNK